MKYARATGALCLVLACGAAPQNTAQESASRRQAELASEERGPVDRRAMDHHFRSPEAFAESWNNPERDAWQKPDEIVRAMAVSRGDTVVDLGAGTGYLVPHLREAVGQDGHVLALDVEDAMVEYLEAQIAELAWTNVEAQQNTHDDPGLDAELANAVVTLNTWHHVEHRVAFARRIRSALVSGGRFVIVDFLPEPTEGHGPPLEMRISAESLVSELERAGFSAEVVAETLPRHYIVVATRD